MNHTNYRRGLRLARIGQSREDRGPGLLFRFYMNSPLADDHQPGRCRCLFGKHTAQFERCTILETEAMQGLLLVNEKHALCRATRSLDQDRASPVDA